MSRRRRPSLVPPSSCAPGPGPRTGLRGLGLSLGFLLTAVLLLRVYLSVESGPAPDVTTGGSEVRITRLETTSNSDGGREKRLKAAGTGRQEYRLSAHDLPICVLFYTNFSPRNQRREVHQ
ncbi:hypothetical protein NDU88_003930 [Pleurodeles waltl]|uniref:Uncharacterized protein n=1 Tax=Pleurodeles waltl TaxID=8319 RepID=A0AAV7MTN1_PLEWA|nr:hypothetical protein NDU88_003930 [Pleurodeles waltl]